MDGYGVDVLLRVDVILNWCVDILDLLVRRMMGVGVAHVDSGLHVGFYLCAMEEDADV